MHLFGFTVGDAVDVGVVVQHVANAIGSRRSVGDTAGFDGDGGVVAGDGRVVAAGDDDHQLRAGLQAKVIGHGVGEGVAQGLAGGAQCLDFRQAVVEHVAPGAVGIQREVAIGAAQDAAHAAGSARVAGAAGADTDHRERIVFRVGVVGQHIAAGIDACLGIVQASGFDGVALVWIGCRGVVAAEDDDVQLRLVAKGAPVGYLVGEDVLDELEIPQRQDFRIAGIDEIGVAAVLADDQSTVAADEYFAVDAAGAGNDRF
ncbi:hypothetical protein D9M71_285760 [compost metagenome]